MHGFLAAIALLGGGDSCEAPLPRGPAVPARILLSTDCGWFRLGTDGSVNRLPADFLAKRNQAWRRRHGTSLAVRRTPSGRYLVVRRKRVIWRSAGVYPNDYMGVAFGRGAFAFGSYRRGVFLTDLESPERLVVRGRTASPLDFAAGGELLVWEPSGVVVVSRQGVIVRRYRVRRSTGHSIDERTKTLYFVTPEGMLSEARGSNVRRIARTSTRGSIGVLGRRLLTFVGRSHVAVLRRSDGSTVARASWRPELGELDSGVDVSDDGRLFAFRVAKSVPGHRRSRAVAFVLRAGEGRAQAVYRHRLDERGCGTGASVDWGGSSVLYQSVDGTGVAEAVVLSASGSVTRLTPLLRALPRISRWTPGSAFWEAGFRS